MSGTQIVSPEQMAPAVVFEPSGRASAQYNPAHYPPRDATQTSPTALTNALVSMVQKHAANLELPRPVLDERLSTIADDMARLSSSGHPPPYRAIEFALARYGVVEPSPQLVILRTRQTETLEHIVGELEKQIDAALKSMPPRRVGAGTMDTADGSLIVVLVLQQSFIQMDPVAREIAKGASVRLRGHLLEPFEDPELFVTRSDGSTFKKAVSGKRARTFSGIVDCPGKGRQQVEVIGNGPRGPQVLANFPVWCDDDAPASVRIEVPSLGSMDVADVEQVIFERVNAERREFRLPAVVWDERSARMARGHSDDMLQHDFVGHVSKTTGGPSDRARAAGVASPLLLENVAFAHSAEEAHAGLMNSPGHRANILNAEVTHVGIGIVTAESTGDGSPELYVTEVFTRVVSPVSMNDARITVLHAMEDQRAKAHLPPMDSDRTLENLAQTFATNLGRTSGEARAPSLERATRKYASVTTEIVIIADANRATSDRLMRASAAGIGIGIAQGHHPQLGDNALYVVIIIGHRGNS
ncbi:MAG: CAP domain-containing protein [Clostridia bacterium]|nr:CAP domain-containing protein [Deltaproteobacteria bacterium]